MELSCFWELTGLEKIGVVGAIAVGLILFIIGLILAFRRPSSTKNASGRWKGVWVSLPMPLAFIVFGIAFVVGAGWWFSKSFPTENISFSQKPWTLMEVKERIERESRLRIDLKDEAGSFVIGRRFSGACASDLLTSICQFYSSKLQCEYDPGSRTFVIAMRP